MRNTITLFYLFFSTFVFSQDSPDYEMDLPIEQADVIAALNLAGLTIYNFNVRMPDTNRYYLLFTIQEFIGKELINEKEWVSITTPYKAYEGQEKVQKNLEKIRVIVYKDEKDTSNKSFVAEIFGARTSSKLVTFLNNEFHYFFDSTPFKIKKSTLNLYHPLVMIGSSWSDQDGRERYCMDNSLSPDYSSEAFSLMPSYYIIGYKLLNKKHW